ncbi:MAG: hypothetical protein JXQ72_14990 [Anaerolineae bacterium]|nr:hypothetical protein [Anaerolineae bacterium]
MQRFRVWWNSFKTVALLISFTVNMVLLVVLLIVLMQIFQIKNGILEPLIDGLHANFVGLDQAVIERTIAVDDEIPVVFDLPLNQATNVILTEDVPIAASATFTLPGGGGMINGRVDIVLPTGLILPVQLNMIVPVDTRLAISLPVEVSIPLRETQLHQPFDNLRNLLEPYVRVLDNLPSAWDDVPDFIIDAAQGEGVNLVSPTYGSENPWPIQKNGEPPSDAGEDQSPAAGDTGTDTGTEPAADDAGTEPAGPEPTVTPVEDIGIIPSE